MGAGGDGKCNLAERERCTIQHGEYLEWACEHCEKGAKD